MNQSTANGDARRHWILRVAGLVALLLITFIAATAIRIVRESSGEGLKSADVIVVFGAADYAAAIIVADRHAHARAVAIPLD